MDKIIFYYKRKRERERERERREMIIKYEKINHPI